MTQYSLFGAEAATPGLDDLDGLLLAGGQWVRGPGGARLSVVVDDRWRAVALASSLADLDLAVGPDDEQTVRPTDGGFTVRTRFAPSLVEYAARWTRGARQGVPAGFGLGAGGLRAWAVAAGYRDESGYLLATATSTTITATTRASTSTEQPVHQAAGAQLSRLGVAATSLTRRASGLRPGWRVTSAKRLRRLAELVGPPPDGCGPDWPDPGAWAGPVGARPHPT